MLHDLFYALGMQERTKQMKSLLSYETSKIREKYQIARSTLKRIRIKSNESGSHLD